MSDAHAPRGRRRRRKPKAASPPPPSTDAAVAPTDAAVAPPPPPPTDAAVATPPPPPPPVADLAAVDEALAALAERDARIGWPAERPACPENPDGWFLPANMAVLRQVLPRARVVLELGSYIGKSTRFLAAHAPADARVLTCDLWDNAFLEGFGEGELGHNYLRGGGGGGDRSGDGRARGIAYEMYATFLANLWAERARVTPFKMRTLEFLAIVHRAGISPDLVYVDADHDYAPVRADVAACLELFPRAVVCGDDWDYAGVRQAVQECRGDRPLSVQDFKCWIYGALESPRDAGGGGSGGGGGGGGAKERVRRVVVPAARDALALEMAGVSFHLAAAAPPPVARFRVLFDVLAAWDNEPCLRRYLAQLPPLKGDGAALAYGCPQYKGRTLLMVAAAFGRERAVALLLERGADVNAQAAGSGEHALQLAAWGGHAGATRLLLARGADRTLRTKFKETAEAAARTNGHAAIAELIRDWGRERGGEGRGARRDGGRGRARGRARGGAARCTGDGGGGDTPTATPSRSWMGDSGLAAEWARSSVGDGPT